MKISKDKQAGLNFPEWFQKQIVYERAKEIAVRKDVPDVAKKKAIEEIAEIVSENNNKFYIFTDAAHQISKSLKLDMDKFDANFLSVIKNGKKVTYLMGDIFYRWIKTEEKIMVFGCHQRKLTPEEKAEHERTNTPPEYLSEFGKGKPAPEFDARWYFFSIHLAEDSYSLPPFTVAPFTKDTWIEFIKMIIFTELSELETVMLEPNQKIGTKKTGKYLNESKSRVVIVDSAWSKKLIKSDGFLVSGHSRLQPFGEKNKYRKYIWIDTYTKEGYTREATMLKHNK
jgi:hypothetical protein